MSLLDQILHRQTPVTKAPGKPHDQAIMRCDAALQRRCGSNLQLGTRRTMVRSEYMLLAAALRGPESFPDLFLLLIGQACMRDLPSKWRIASTTPHGYLSLIQLSIDALRTHLW